MQIAKALLLDFQFNWRIIFFEHPITINKKNQNQKQNAFFLFLPLFWAYVEQMDNHMGWATSKPFASIYPTHPRTNPWNFHEKILRIGGAGKWHFFGFWLLGFSKKNFPMKISLVFIWGIIYFCTMDGFFRILKKTSSELICTRLCTYINATSFLVAMPTKGKMLPRLPNLFSFLSFPQWFPDVDCIGEKKNVARCRL